MKTRALLFCFWSCLSIFAVTSARAADVTRNHPIPELLSELRSITGVAGFSMAIVKDGEVVEQLAVGTVDKTLETPVEPEHLFRLASVSKVVGSTLVASLIQQNKLNVDDRVRRWLPELPSKYSGITVRQLVNHTSGMPHYQTIDACCWDTRYDLALDSLEVLKDRDLLSSPGTEYHYSSFGYTVLGALYERVAEKTLEQGLSEFVLQLTGRQSPKIENITKRNRLRTNAFEQTSSLPKTVPFDDKSYSALGGGLTASATDLALFGDAVLHSKELTYNTRELLFNVQEGSPTTGNSLYEVGFGWRVGEDFRDNKVFHHSGVTLGARSFLALYPDIGVSIAFLSNTSWTAQIETNAFTLVDLILDKNAGSQKARTMAVSGEFREQVFEATLDCVDMWCSLEEQTSSLSGWLNRYNSVESRKPISQVKTWKAYQTSEGLVLVTSIGLVYLRKEKHQWVGKIGGSTTLKFTAV